MQIDPIRKFQIIDDINKYIDKNFLLYNEYNDCHNYDHDRIDILLEYFNIPISHSYDKQFLNNVENDKINQLHNYLLINNSDLLRNNNEGLKDLFHDKYATEVLAQEEKFFNLNLYLNECFECIKYDRKIATAILLRCCIDIFINIFDSTSKPLANKINNFCNLANNNTEFEIFTTNGKQDELQKFLDLVKQFGNDVVHLNGKNIKELIEKYDNKEILKLFCVLIEHSILKDDINIRNKKDVENRVKSIDFTLKEKPSVSIDEVINPGTDEDEEIPF